MTNDEASAPTDPLPDHEEMLQQVDTAIANLTTRINSDQLDEPKIEEIRLKQYRTLGYLVRTKRQVLKDKVLEELTSEIEALKAGTSPDAPVTIGASDS